MAVRDFVVEAAVKQDYEEHKWPFPCDDCGRGFECKHGLAVHRGRYCKQYGKASLELEKIVDVRGTPEERFYRVRWAGFGEDDDQWINWRQLDALDAIDQFWEGATSLDRSKTVWLDLENGLRCRQHLLQALFQGTRSEGAPHKEG